MESKIVWLIIGIALGWLLKFPFLLKWYSDLKKTNDYRNMNDAIRWKEMVEKYNQMFPDEPYKSKKQNK